MRNALSMADSLDAMIKDRQLLKLLIEKQGALADKDVQLISSLKENARLADILIETLRGQVTNLEKQNGNEKKIETDQRKIIRHKNWVIIKKTLISATVIGGLILLFIKK